MRKTVLLVIALLLIAGQAIAGIVSTTDPSVATEIGARIRWGATGFEASIFDNSPFGQSPTLNPSGAPVWGVGNAYKFSINFNSVTGALELGVDFNRDNTFTSGSEVISRNLFTAPSLADYTGYGFNYLSISGNESGSTARSQVSNLVINGTSLPSIAPNGLFLENFYKDSSGNPMASVSITGDLTFSTAGTAQERPSWNFNFKDPVDLSQVPEPGTLLLLGFGLMGLAGFATRRKK